MMNLVNTYYLLSSLSPITIVFAQYTQTSAEYFLFRFVFHLMLYIPSISPSPLSSKIQIQLFGGFVSAFVFFLSFLRELLKPPVCCWLLLLVLRVLRFYRFFRIIAIRLLLSYNGARAFIFWIWYKIKMMSSVPCRLAWSQLIWKLKSEHFSISKKSTQCWIFRYSQPTPKTKKSFNRGKEDLRLFEEIINVK